MIAVLHDINLALHFADAIYFMKGGSITYRLEEPHHVTEAIIEDVFDVKSTIFQSGGEKPVVVF